MVPKFNQFYSVQGTNILEFKQISDQDQDSELEILGEYSITDFFAT